MMKHDANRHWSGHFPVTSTALLSILERAASGETRFSTIERRLYLACEVWAAVNAGDLRSLFESVGSGALREAPAAFSAIGAERVADILRKTLIHSIDGSSMAALGERIAAIEDDLRRIPAPVDEMIARFARGYLCAAARLCESASVLPQRASG